SRRARSGSCARVSATRFVGTRIPRRWNGMAIEARPRPLEGRNAVVTGVGSGLGQAIAREFAAEGALVLGCDVDDAAGAATMSGIGEYLHADVSREAEVEALVARAVELHGRPPVIGHQRAVQLE